MSTTTTIGRPGVSRFRGGFELAEPVRSTPIGEGLYLVVEGRAYRLELWGGDVGTDSFTHALTDPESGHEIRVEDRNDFTFKGPDRHSNTTCSCRPGADPSRRARCAHVRVLRAAGIVR